MTKSAQQALKYLLQTCENNVRFCLICNYICKVDDSLQNEFLTIRFNQLPEDNIHDFIQNIANKEELNLQRNTIKCIQKKYGSDIRSIINFIQLNQNIDFSTWENHIINDNVYRDIHELFLSNNTYDNIKKNICYKTVQYNIDKKTFIIEYLNYLFKDDKYLMDNIIQVAKSISHNNIGNTILLDYFISEMQMIYKDM
jgi:replication factor C subunit 3/5